MSRSKDSGLVQGVLHHTAFGTPRSRGSTLGRVNAAFRSLPQITAQGQCAAPPLVDFVIQADFLVRLTLNLAKQFLAVF